MNKFDIMRTIVDNAEFEYKKLIFKKNKSAGVRYRKHLQDIKDLAADLRLESKELTKTLKSDDKD